jgi:hypothetical protein
LSTSNAYLCGLVYRQAFKVVPKGYQRGTT